MLLVPPLIDYRALLTSKDRLVVSRVWRYVPFEETNLKSTHIDPITPKAVHQASQQGSTKQDRALNNHGETDRKRPDLANGCTDPPQTPPYTPPDVAAPHSPLSHNIHPYQSDPYPGSSNTNSERRDLPGSNKDVDLGQRDANEGENSLCGPGKHQPQRDIPKTNPPVSPTVTWTNLPVSQPSQQPDRLCRDMAVDLESSPANLGNNNNEDSEMLPCKPNPPSTPDCKGTQAALDSGSSQKDPPPPEKVTGEDRKLCFLTRKTLMLRPSLSNGKDNMFTSNAALVVVPDFLPPRHQTLSLLSLRQLLASCASLGLTQGILWIVILSPLPPRVRESAKMTVCLPDPRFSNIKLPY